jgi:hypothetical protein
MIAFATTAALFPNRYTLFPPDVAPAAAAILYGIGLVSLVIHAVPSLHRFERPMVIVTTILTSLVAVAYFITVIGRIAVGGSDLKGGPLLGAAITVWILTVFSFSLWYWILDDGDDFFFPQNETDRFPSWSPKFLDYLFLAFTTSTAFSPTDVLPASRRAKMLMMIQASLSLATIAIAASRAVNVMS